MSSSGNRIRKHIFFSGRVQGVGFRYRARCLAQRYGLTGWVRNLWDDRVEMEIQGKETAIDALIVNLERGHFIEISRMEVESCPIDVEESGFYITE